MIQLLDLCKSFEDKEVLKHIDSTFEAGKTNLIIGQSGSGRRFEKCIVGLLSPHLGPDSLPRAQFREYEKRERGYAETRDGNGLPIFGSLRQSHRRRERDVSARHVFRRKLQGTSTPCAVLSGSCEPVRCRRQISGRNFGRYAKRVAIARAIALKPKYLFCDEPNSGLDPKTSLVIDELIHSITHEDGTTTIINTHDMNSVMGIGEHILIFTRTPGMGRHKRRGDECRQ